MMPFAAMRLRTPPTGPAPVGPDSLSGLTLWIDPNDTSTLLSASGGSIVTTDGSTVGMTKSKASLALCMDAASSAPVLKTAVYAGRNALRFAPPNVQAMAFRSGDVVGGAAQPGNIMAVGEFTVISAINVFSASSPAANFWQNGGVIVVSGYAGLHIADLDASNVTVSACNYDTNSDVVSAALPKNALAIVTMKHSGGNLSLRINGVNVGSTASGDTGSVSTSINTPGSTAYISAANMPSLDIAQLATYNAANSDGDIYLVEQAIAASLGLSI